MKAFLVAEILNKLQPDSLSLLKKKAATRKKVWTIYFERLSELTVKSTFWACSPFLSFWGIKPLSNIVLAWGSTRSPLELIKNPRNVNVQRSWLKNKYGWGLKRNRKIIMKDICMISGNSVIMSRFSFILRPESNEKRYRWQPLFFHKKRNGHLLLIYTKKKQSFAERP